MANKRKKTDAGAKKLPNVRFDFNAAVHKARTDHPQLKRRAVYIDATQEDWLMSVVAQRPALEKNDEACDELEEAVKKARSLRSSFCTAIDTGRGKDVKAVVLHRDRFPLYDSKDREIDDIGTFDHETAHVLHETAKGSTTKGENIADAFAVMRHFQRYAGQTTEIDYCGWKRALVFMLSGVDTHLTTFTVDKITLDAKSADFVSLSPKQTAAIARTYAERFSPKAKALEKLKRDFKKMAGKKHSQEALSILTDITLAAPIDSDTFYLGARVLAPALKKGGATLDGKTVALDGERWRIVAQKLDKKIARLPQEHALRRLA